MRSVIIALAGALALTQTAVAQEQDGEVSCSWMQSEIALQQQTLSGLSAFLANTDGYGMLVCNPTFSRDKCIEGPEVIAFWTDTETGENFVLFTRDFIIGFAQDAGMPSEHVEMIFARNDGISHKLRSGGVDIIQAEISGWQAEYARVCNGD